MRWVKVDGKGVLHFSKYSMDREDNGTTVCGRTGRLVPIAKLGDARRCKKCRETAEGMQ